MEEEEKVGSSRRTVGSTTFFLRVNTKLHILIYGLVGDCAIARSRFTRTLCHAGAAVIGCAQGHVSHGPCVMPAQR